MFTSEDAKARYRLDVYNANAEKVGSYYFDMDYTDIFFGKGNFVIYNETKCLITDLDNTVKYEGDFSESVRLMISTGNSYKYVLITDDSIDTIQLK